MAANAGSLIIIIIIIIKRQASRQQIEAAATRFLRPIKKNRPKEE
jgi:hypothetical protein